MTSKITNFINPLQWFAFMKPKSLGTSVKKIKVDTIINLIFCLGYVSIYLAWIDNWVNNSVVGVSLSQFGFIANVVYSFVHFVAKIVVFTPSTSFFAMLVFHFLTYKICKSFAKKEKKEALRKRAAAVFNKMVVTLACISFVCYILIVFEVFFRQLGVNKWVALMASPVIFICVARVIEELFKALEGSRSGFGDY